MSTNEEVRHIAQHLAAQDIALDFEAVRDQWQEFNQTPYIIEASKLITVIDALASFRGAASGEVIGYAVAGRDGTVSVPRGRTLAGAEQLRDEFTAGLVKGHDWDYRVVAITELPAE